MSAHDLLDRHFAQVRANRISAKDPVFRRLERYRAALMLLDNCARYRRMVASGNLHRRTATRLWERDFKVAQMQRLAFGFHLAGEKELA